LGHIKNVKIVNYRLRDEKVQSDQKENKSEQALQVISHVVADSVQMSVQNAWV
jgi:phage gp36-like protein